MPEDKMSTLGPHFKPPPPLPPPVRPSAGFAEGRGAGQRSGGNGRTRRREEEGRETPSAGEFSGFLYKQGQYLRQWKRRFFVLDSVRHQLQYYESEDRTTYRGFIALDNVKSVKQTELRRSSATPVKKLPDHAYIIEVETDRPHRFAAEDAGQANAWCEQLQASIS